MTKIEQLKTEIQSTSKAKTEFQKQQTDNQTYLENRRTEEARKIKRKFALYFYSRYLFKI